MARITRGTIALFIVALLSLCFFVTLLSAKSWGPVSRQSIGQQKVFAYRGWQSTGYTIEAGDIVTVRAEGSWLYSPVAGFNGPEGHDTYWAPSFYPLPGVGGGALIGKVGDFGKPFYVGRYGRFGGPYADFSRESGQERGTLYLRIDDDLLGDNKGYVTARVQVEEPEGRD